MPSFNYADFNVVKAIALTFPGTEKSVSHEGTPSAKMRGNLMCRLHDSGKFIPIQLDLKFRDQYLDSHPEIFHLPDHFKASPYICMWKFYREVGRLWQVAISKMEGKWFLIR